MDNLKFYLKKISTFFENFLTRMSTGILIGFVVGMILFLTLQKDVSGFFLLLLGAFVGVFAEIFVDFGQKAFQTIRLINPLSRVLGTVSEEDSWIYISAWRRQLDDLEHSKLYRNDPKRLSQPIIVGSQYVYGKGDAIALSYVYQAIEKSTKGKTRITVEDSEQMLDYWNRSIICIGAHNSKTREILAKFQNTYFRFELNYSIIVEANAEIKSNKSGLNFVKGVNRSIGRDSSDIDYAVILKLKDEYHPNKTIIVIAGLGDDGTAGAAYYLLNNYRNLPFEEETFGVLIEVPSGYESARKVDFHQVSKLFDLSV
ncbi:MAG TPA: hypothetical protein DIW23_06350 [Anaerolineae bacterium]|nr:hypothetical protein [Anaerolineae bacterium]